MRIPFLTKLGASLLLGMAWLANCGGKYIKKSWSLPKKDNQRGCTSSMMEISTLSTMGTRLPFMRW